MVDCSIWQVQHIGIGLVENLDDEANDNLLEVTSMTTTTLAASWIQDMTGAFEAVTNLLIAGVITVVSMKVTCR